MNFLIPPIEYPRTGAFLRSPPAHMNQLSGEKKAFSLDSSQVLRSLPGDGGILPIYATLNETIGNEVILLFYDRTPFIYDVARVKPFRLKVRYGLVNTGNGPLFFIVYIVPDSQDRPFAVHENHLNPLDPDILGPYQQLASQSSWHVLLVDHKASTVDLIEFVNFYRLEETLEQVLMECASLSAGNFDLAKQEFCSSISLEDILEM